MWPTYRNLFYIQVTDSIFFRKSCIKSKYWRRASDEKFEKVGLCKIVKLLFAFSLNSQCPHKQCTFFITIQATATNLSDALHHLLQWNINFKWKCSKLVGGAEWSRQNGISQKSIFQKINFESPRRHTKVHREKPTSALRGLTILYKYFNPRTHSLEATRCM